MGLRRGALYVSLAREALELSKRQGTATAQDISELERMLAGSK